MKFIPVLILMTLLVSCGTSNKILVNEKWRAEEFKDYEHPDDVLISKVDSKHRKVYFLDKNKCDSESIHQFKTDYRRLTLPNSNVILMRHHIKNKQ